MITQIDISNFRSIKQQSIHLKKLNILYGANGSGKSSVAYAPYVMRNFFRNPNQRLNSLFNLGFINLGGFENVLSSGTNINGISICIKIPLDSKARKLLKSFDKDDSIYLKIELFENSTGKIKLKIKSDSFTSDIVFPHTLLEKKVITLLFQQAIWDGLTFEKPNTKELEIFHMGNGAIEFLNGIYETIKNIEVISVRRGFFNPIFSTEFTDDLESNFALTIRNEGIDFETKIDHYFKQIFNKTFRFIANPNSSYFYLKTQNSKGLTTDLVNEGFGVNQTVYMLAKLLKKNTSLAFIEEPEIHLHPSAQAKLVDAFIDIVQNEDKQIFLSTHSENIVSTVLAKIATGELNKDDVQFYLAKFEDGETKIIPQEVNDKGQVEGGLMSFMETELSNLKAMLGI